LALYVYEYLLHVGAQKAAQTFLNEVKFILKVVYIFSEILPLIIFRSDGRRISHWGNRLAFFTPGGGK
jgi:hypothetical protein